MQKLIFAHQLRGIAVVMVMITHLMGVYWGLRDVVAAHVFAPAQSADVPYIAHLAFSRYYDFGPLGVAIFFLISGFVIPMSLHKLRGFRFLLSRGFRIYPTYIVCTFISLAALALSAAYWGTDFSVNLRHLIANLLLLHNYLAIPTFDLINWTLAIEIKFYLLMAILAPLIIKHRVYPIVLVAAVTFALNFQRESLAPLLTPAINVVLQQAAFELLYVVYMLIGVLFYYHYQARLSTIKLLVCVAGLFFAFSQIWQQSLVAPQYTTFMQNYVYGLIIFSSAYACRDYFRPIRLLDMLGSISYPLYILHSLIGYSALNILMDQSLSYAWALLLTVILLVSLSYAVHRLCELPSNRWGKKIAHFPFSQWRSKLRYKT